MLEAAAPGPSPTVTIRHRLAVIRGDREMSRIADELEAIGARLGTPDERDNDAASAQQLGHQLRNLLCSYDLQASLAQLGLALAQSTRRHSECGYRVGVCTDALA